MLGMSQASVQSPIRRKRRHNGRRLHQMPADCGVHHSGGSNPLCRGDRPSWHTVFFMECQNARAILITVNERENIGLFLACLLESHHAERARCQRTRGLMRINTGLRRDGLIALRQRAPCARKQGGQLISDARNRNPRRPLVPISQKIEVAACGVLLRRSRGGRRHEDAGPAQSLSGRRR